VEVRKEIEAQGGKAFSVELDVRNKDSIASMAEKVVQEFGHIDIYIPALFTKAFTDLILDMINRINKIKSKSCKSCQKKDLIGKLKIKGKIKGVRNLFSFSPLAAGCPPSKYSIINWVPPFCVAERHSYCNCQQVGCDISHRFLLLLTANC